jgi:hypothetical protein
MTADDIRKLIKAGALAPSTTDVIARLNLQSGSSGAGVDATLHVGWDIAKAWACDTTWGAYNMQLLNFIVQQGYTPAKRDQVLQNVQLDDAHWRWFDKSTFYLSTEYVWLFLMAEQNPQGACLLFHPKAPALGAGNIFYIEYVAVAPWNRKNPMAPKALRGVGSALIKGAAGYAVSTLGLTPGFSLHALPKAVSYYKNIGMQEYPPMDKPPLPYFEMTPQSYETFMRSA